MKDIELPDDRYRAVLVRLRGRIEGGVPLTKLDDDTPGDKSTSASWGLCSDEKEAWPDAEDHLWPDEFTKFGRVAPKYRKPGQHCPFDDRASARDNSPSGCFYRCRLFQARKFENRTGLPIPDARRALRLYDARLAEFDEFGPGEG